MIKTADTHPNHKIICLIGEYHLADKHLPAFLAAECKRRGHALSLMRILNNVDRYYFELQLEQTGNPTEYLKLRKDFFCIINSPPWVKWQSFSIWEEMRHSDRIDGQDVEDDTDDLEFDPDDYDEEDVEDGDFRKDPGSSHDEAFDVDYQFLEFSRHLATFLTLKIEGSDLEAFHVSYSRDGDFYEELSSEARYQPEDIHRIIERVIIDGVFFLSVNNNVLVSSVSINNLAIAAGQYLHRLLTGFDDFGATEMESFYRRTLRAAIGMIASKILNPRRKCTELNDYRGILRRYKGEKLTGFYLTRRDLAKAVLKHDEWIKNHLTNNKLASSRSLITLDKKLNYNLSREIGQMLGYGLYKKVISNQTPATAIRRIFRKRLTTATELWAEIRALYNLMLE